MTCLVQNWAGGGSAVRAIATGWVLGCELYNVVARGSQVQRGEGE
jgi:hypothetical protein